MAAATQRQRRVQQGKQRRRAVAFTDGVDPIDDATAGVLKAKQLHTLLGREGYKQVGRQVLAAREAELFGALAGEAAEEQEQELEEAEAEAVLEERQADAHVDGQRATQPTRDDEQPEEEDGDRPAESPPQWRRTLFLADASARLLSVALVRGKAEPPPRLAEEGEDGAAIRLECI